jgi:PAS domain S-box-containing protein
VSSGPPAGVDGPLEAGRRAGRGGEAHLELALAAGGLGIWEWDRQIGELTWDHTVERLFGIEHRDAPTDFQSYLDLVHPDDREVVAASVRTAVATGEDYTIEHRVEWPDGTVRWLQSRGHPIFDGETVRGLIGVTGDITAEREAEAERERLLAKESAARAEIDAERARLEFLIEAKAALSEVLDLDDRLNELARLSIPRFADGSAVHLLDESGQPVLIALHHRDPDHVELLRHLFERYPVRLGHRVGIGAAIREGRSGWLPGVTDDMLAAVALSERHLDLLRQLHLTTGLVVPLIGPDGPFGAVTFITTHGRRMREADLTLVEQLCSRVAILLRNAQLIEARDRDRKAYRYQAVLLQSVLEASVDGVLAVDPESNVLTYNQRFLELWELDEELTESGDDALLAQAELRVADPEGFIATVKQAYDERPPRLHDQVDLANGRVLDRHGTCLTGPDGEYLGFMWSFRDITLERAQAQAITEAGERSAMLARTLQQSLLPPRLPHIMGIDLAGRYHAAYEGLEIGGDFYDVFSVGGDWILVIGDVCGKGAEAAAVTALARYTIRAAASHDSDPVSMLTELNSVMVSDSSLAEGVQRFVTVCCIRLRRDEDGVFADVSCGGHPPPFLVRSDHRVEPAGAPGTLLGVFDQISLTSSTVQLDPGDAVVMVTDGVLEARSVDGTQLDIEGVQSVIAPLAGASATRLGEEVEAAALAVQDGVARDDIAILVARVQP